MNLGARRILLLGYDLGRWEGQPTHFFGEHPSKLNKDSPYASFRAYYETLLEPLTHLGVTLVNCSRKTALKCVRRMPLREALP